MIVGRSFTSLKKIRLNRERCFSSISFENFGQPAAVCKLLPSGPHSPPGVEEVQVRLKSSEVTQDDILAIRGLSTSTSSSNIGGYYGVGVVTAVGSNVKHVLANDYVFLVSPGTWTDSGVFSAKNVFKISGVSLDAVASISNAISAWGMLKTFEILQPGDVVVHDNGSTPIGKAIEDVGKSIGVKVINATLDELNSTEKVKSFGKVKLAVSGGGESSSKALLRSLSSGSLVVYNGSQPSTTLEGNGLSISMASAIFNGVAVSGFSLRAWAKSSPCKVQEAINDVTKLLASGAITSSAETFPQSDFLKALESVSKTSGSVVLKV